MVKLFTSSMGFSLNEAQNWANCAKSCITMKPFWVLQIFSRIIYVPCSVFCVDIAGNWIFRFDLPIFVARTVLRLKVSAITAVIPLIFLIISVAQKRDNLFVVMSQISDICKESDVPSRITSPGSRAISTPLVYWSTELTSGHFWVTEVTDWVSSHWQKIGGKKLGG